MKAPENFEAVFLAAAVLATFVTYAMAAEPAPRAGAPVASGAMQVVVIHGHRLSDSQKAGLR